MRFASNHGERCSFGSSISADVGVSISMVRASTHASGAEPIQRFTHRYETPRAEQRHGAPLNLTLLGPPEAGKGTQAAILREQFDVVYLATGDMLRRHRGRGTDLGLAASKPMHAGRLVPDDLVIAMVTDALPDDSGSGLLLDGFPRTVAQAEALDDLLRARDRCLTAAILVDVADDVVIDRISGRRVCPSGHVFHVRYNRPARESVCDEDGAPLVRRDDDHPEAVRRRLAAYHDATEPLIARYARLGQLLRVNGAPSADAVFSQIRQGLSAMASPSAEQQEADHGTSSHR
ncbi:adenylate kinase [Solirubrobacter ginsenosidimutans]|uniref:Adenylate kinase n=1 Tax=Solirubrobacter ginsenosidimutans TaxID=490573 RepID=A0A9X3MYR0_9ACTN|nr:adenylate kinase [Solirubrobacter ginsenosidimutans]MDA0164997.1 adenylate kinase [Solirubrobacter ginsenosidimutans]